MSFDLFAILPFFRKVICCPRRAERSLFLLRISINAFERNSVNDLSNSKLNVTFLVAMNDLIRARVCGMNGNNEKIIFLIRFVFEQRN